MEWIFFGFIAFCLYLLRDHELRKKAFKEAYEAQPIVERIDAPGSSKFITTDKELRAAGLFSRSGPYVGHSFGNHSLRYGGDGMMITIAPVGSGKGTVQILPNLLGLDDWSILLLSCKGESGAVSLHHRKSLGPCDHLNPYEALMPSFRGIEQACHNDMDILTDPREPPLTVWQTQGRSLRVSAGAKHRMPMPNFSAAALKL